MLYQRPSFTCPAANSKTTEMKWDLAMLSKKEFIAKYKITPAEYSRLQQGY